VIEIGITVDNACADIFVRILIGIEHEREFVGTARVNYG
jgi:hypothetical protein